MLEKILVTGITASVSAAVIKAGYDIIQWLSSLGIDTTQTITSVDVNTLVSVLERLG